MIGVLVASVYMPKGSPKPTLRNIHETWAKVLAQESKVGVFILPDSWLHLLPHFATAGHFLLCAPFPKSPIDSQARPSFKSRSSRRRPRSACVNTEGCVGVFAILCFSLWKPCGGCYKPWNPCFLFMEGVANKDELSSGGGQWRMSKVGKHARVKLVTPASGQSLTPHLDLRLKHYSPKVSVEKYSEVVDFWLRGDFWQTTL